MAESKGGTPQAKPKRHIRNYLLDRKFQFKYALLLSGASALLMAAMGTLLYMRMKDSERRIQDEAGIAHRNLSHEAEEAAAMLQREMDASAQQLINRRLACEAPPSCPPCNCTSSGGVVTESSGSACDPEMCKPLCDLLGYKEGPAATPPPPSTAPPPALSSVEGLDRSAAPFPDDAPPVAENVAPPEPVGNASEDEQARQRELIRKIEQTVRDETTQRAAEMASETRARLNQIDLSTKARMEELRNANQRDLRAILIAVVIVFVILAAVGIVVTHKVVGPIYRIRMLLGKIDGDHLFLAGQLRKGDELQDLFEEIQKMLDRLRAHQDAEIQALAGLFERLRAAGEDDRAKVLDDLDAFRTRMVSALDRK